MICTVFTPPAGHCVQAVTVHWMPEAMDAIHSGVQRGCICVTSDRGTAVLSIEDINFKAHTGANIASVVAQVAAMVQSEAERRCHITCTTDNASNILKAMNILEEAEVIDDTVR